MACKTFGDTRLDGRVSGAARASVLGLALQHSTLLTLAGVVLGVGAASMLTRYLQNLLFNLTPLDVMTFAVMPTLFAVVAAVASYLPARRATKLDPETVLRCDEWCGLS